MSKNRETKRDTNIELLRMVLMFMFMVLLIHLITHGSGLFTEKQTEGNSLYFEYLIFSFSVVCVNSFLFISAYYGIKFKVNHLVSFVLQAVFYSVILYLAFNLNDIKPDKLIRSFFPVATSTWWFLTSFIVLYIVSPFINYGFTNLSQKHLKILLLFFLYADISSFVLNLIGKPSIAGNGFGFFHFITIYVLGRYWKSFKAIPKNAFKIYMGVSLLLFIVLIFLSGNNKYELIRGLFAYNNPLVIVSSVYLFFAFKNLKIRQMKTINNLSIGVFAVYLIHDYGYTRNLMVDIVQKIHSSLSNNVSFYISIFIFSILIFIFCLGIEKIRQFLFKPIERKIGNLLNLD